MNKNKRFSPSELNRFTYCPYQWYYERLYGRKKLMELFREKNGNHHGSGNSPIAYGNKFHKNYYFLYRVKTLIKFILIIIVILLFLFLTGDVIS